MFVPYCVGNGLCNGLITRTGNPTGGRGACVCLIKCDRETSIVRWARPNWGCSATEIFSNYFSFQSFLTPIVVGYFSSYICGALVCDSERSNRTTYIVVMLYGLILSTER